MIHCPPPSPSLSLGQLEWGRICQFLFQSNHHDSRFLYSTSSSSSSSSRCHSGWCQVLSDGRLYMNSCGMYDDFMVDPEKDAAAANALWEEWFGPTPNTTTAAAAGAAPAAASEVTRITQAVVDEESVGPFNDACVQDGATWGGPPHYTNGLLPPRCTII